MTDQGTVPTGEVAEIRASTIEEAAADQLASVNLSDAEGQDKEPTSLPGKEDPELWKPHPPREECPVCLVPLPLENSLASYWSCCGMVVCKACKEENRRALVITNRKRAEKKLQPIERSCAFCRSPLHKTDSECINQYHERINKDDLMAMFVISKYYRSGELGVVKDNAESFKWIQRAADLGFPEAIFALGYCFLNGVIGVIQDEEKGILFMEEAAKKGDVTARYRLGCLETKLHHHDLAIRHFKLAAAAGDEAAMKELWKYFSSHKLTKPELEETLRAHKLACDEMNSEHRERYVAMSKAWKGDDETLKGLYAGYYVGFITAKELNKALKAYRRGDTAHVINVLSKIRHRRANEDLN